jgi:hypothetical protein
MGVNVALGLIKNMYRLIPHRAKQAENLYTLGA